jgi:ABC-type multidrug transport system fused ATPase/permease subunit
MTTIDGQIIMSKNQRKVDMHGLQYAAQIPWLRHQSIKENILFDSPYDEERYDAVPSCALKPDLAVLEDGDAAEIGARFVEFSTVWRWCLIVYSGA